jgi:structural maintenance of chromosome 2
LSNLNLYQLKIATGNKHKYLINGQNATAQRVSDLFCSVQLNVNNPNFLIMQGKITKVLNMKPVEILSMIEEAAGTKMYDMKKANALQTIEKKNAKLNEIERVLREDITPQIERLKQERSAYIEYQKCDREYLHLHKFTVAHQFWETEHSVNKAKADTQEVEGELEANARRVEEILEANERLKREIKEFADSITSKGKNKGGDNKETEELEKLEHDMKQLRIEITKLNTQMNNLKSSADGETKREKEIEKSVKESKTLIGKKEKTLDDMKSKMDKVEADLKSAEEELTKAQKEYEALCCGFVIDDDSNQMTLQDQLLNTRNKISDKKTQSKKAQLK